MVEAVDAIEQSLECVVARAGDPASRIYASLFAEFPETEECFARDVTGAVRAEMLTTVFDCLMDPDGPYQIHLVRAERINHDGFGVPPRIFNRFFWIVMKTCRELAGPDWTAPMEAAWTARIRHIEAASA